jgi:uncharacterized protein (TIGR03000 family)
MRGSMAVCGVLIGLQGLVAADTMDGLSRGQTPVAAATATRAHFDVTVPRNDAVLLVDGAAAQPTGWERVVESGPLEQGKRYQSTFTVMWRPNGYTVLTRTKTISFTAGETVSVDLTRDEGNDRAEVRYVPTPDYVVGEMVKLASITPDDVVYEPGCGDARITIAAVRAGAKRGVGIDLDAARVAESRANVTAARLGDRVEIRQGDALDIKDLSDATVVFLYMGDEFDMLIRPILWRQLRVGARVVSHRFVMGDWVPDTTVNIDDGGNYELHLWTITEEVKKRAEQP